MFLVGLMGGGYACAAEALDGSGVQDLGGGKGKVAEGESSYTKNSEQMDQEWYIKQLNKTIVEMKFTGTPIDQILRSATSNKSQSIVVKYYSVGQRPLRATLAEDIAASTNETPKAIQLEDNSIIGAMDTLLVLNADGSFVPGYVNDVEDPYHPLMLRVNSVNTDSSLPMVYAVNGKKSSNGNPYLLPAIKKGSVLLRMGRAAAEKDVATGRYYQLPSPDEQYCQRFIMQVEQTVYDRFSKKEVDWSFTRIERMAMEDMRIGIEASGLFGIKGVHQAFSGQGNVFTTEGIWYRAGKDLELGHWEKKLDAAGNEIVADGKVVQEYVITEDELVDLIGRIIEGAGNGSRTKLVFVDNFIYSALCKVRSNNRTRIFHPEKNDEWKLEFDSFESMGTKLLFYRHDLFNAWGFSGKGFSLDPEYLDKWTFGNWERKEYDLKELFISNSDAVVMEEFSCWTLGFPDAHARITIPEYQEITATAA
jgi:hypothetical protein